jgi:uncharacterized protein YjbI with pentapeptide repeats
MKAAEVIQEYKNRRRDFQGESLRGCNFKNQDLSGADFSGCDIRGANFSGANLTEAKFEKAKAGLRKRSVVVLLLAALVLMVISSLFFAPITVFISYIFDFNQLASSSNRIVGWVSLYILIFFGILIWRKNILGAAVAVVAAVTIAGTVAGVVAVLDFKIPIMIDTGIAVVGTSGLMVLGATTVVAFVLAVLGGIAAVFLSLILVVVVGLLAALGRELGAIVGAVVILAAGIRTVGGVSVTTLGEAVVIAGIEPVKKTLVVILTLFFCYIGWLTLEQEYREPWLRRIVIAFAALGGTSFFQANLTATDFTGATLKSTNFNQAILNKTIFKQAIKLELARPGKTLLVNPQVRELLINPSTGAGQDLTKADLRGANLDGANLQRTNLRLADLSQASFRYANLREANLTEVNAVNADLSHATLTGACVENWNIDATTQLAEVDCQYIYLLNNQKERRPSSGEFEQGEFTKLFAEVFDTVDLIFREGVDWKALANTLKEVQVQNEDTPLELHSIENKGDGVVIIKVHVPPEANKEKIHQEFNQNYQLQLAAVEAQYKAQLSAKETEITIYRQHNSTLENIVNTLASKPTNIEIINNKQDQSQAINVGQDLTIEAKDSTVNLRDTGHFPPTPS